VIVMTLKVLFFATLRDKTGVRTVSLNVKEGTNIEQLKEKLVDMYPNLRGTIEHCLFSVNRDYGLEDMALPDHAEIAFFPHVSGG
jgi:molybdopterin converting factor subunit 1